MSPKQTRFDSAAIAFIAFYICVSRGRHATLTCIAQVILRELELLKLVAVRRESRAEQHRITRMAQRPRQVEPAASRSTATWQGFSHGGWRRQMTGTTLPSRH